MSDPEKPKLVDDKEVRCVKKPRFTFEWVELSSDTAPESVTAPEDPEEERSVIKEVIGSDLEPLLPPEPKEDKLDFTRESVNGAADPDSLDYHAFSVANLSFGLVIQPTHLHHKYCVAVPARIANELPRKCVPVVLHSDGKSWTMVYNGHLRLRSFDHVGWRLFADDNKLKLGDACFFEILENSNTRIVFKVVVLRTAFNPCAGGDTVEASDSCAGGNAEDEPILIE